MATAKVTDAELRATEPINFARPKIKNLPVGSQEPSLKKAAEN
jgi:hypothetical protein